jgi:UDP-N-acetylglucosamine/UDP-N-acetylgalactosamine diphosphorylase
MKTPSPIFLAGDTRAQETGRKLILSGKVGTVILSAGQATRLGITTPKGFLPITPIRKRSLFELLSSKVAACCKLYGRPLPIAFMTSRENHEEIVQFFRSHSFFGLEEGQISFFMQSSRPLFRPDGSLLLRDDGTPFLASDGNGAFYWSFEESGILEKWIKLGIEYITLAFIDNPLVDPFDSECIGRASLDDADAVIKVIERQDPEESVGCLVDEEGKIAIREYTDLSKSDKEERGEDGALKLRYANIAYFCLKASFIKKISELKKENFPLHIAKKVLPKTNTEIIKGEYFIFDMLKKARSIEAICFPREVCFAPVKEKEGPNSPKAVQKKVMEQDKKTFETISGVKLAPDAIIELSSQFYYPTEELKNKWKGKLPHFNSYLE